MKSTFINIAVFVFHFYCVSGELEFYPGFQRPESVVKWENEQRAEEYALEQFTKYLQEQQRRLALRKEPEPDFTYSAPVRTLDDIPEFAVAPSDPRYYQNIPEDDNEEEDEELNFEPSQQDEFLSHEQLSYQNPQSTINDEFPYQPQFPLNEKSISNDLLLSSNNFQPFQYSNQLNQRSNNNQNDNNIILKTRTEEKHKQLMENDLLALANGGYRHLDHAVEMTPVRSTIQDDTAGVYIIAVVAGISAAATVALIAFAIGWYNLQKNVKNASDVEYPAYGVTGPNKDLSPTGDRRLAQSAQMYHYQHQKQQIIAMESRAGITVRHGSMSEAESEEENEEGDYTVYECPGLAPAGEMEVKNPLFQDDTTPALRTPKGEQSQPDQK